MRLVTLLVFVFLILTKVLEAASVPQVSFERVVSSSPRAVHGVVVRSWSAWDDARAAIWTHYEVRVRETLRGPAAATFTISEPGGEIDGLAMRVPGSPRMQVDEEAVLFAYPTPLGYWRIQGWGQGLFPVESGERGPLVRAPRLEGVTLQKQSAPTKAASVASVGGERLDAFLDRVRSLIRAEEGR